MDRLKSLTNILGRLASEKTIDPSWSRSAASGTVLSRNWTRPIRSRSHKSLQASLWRARQEDKSERLVVPEDR